MLSLYVADRWSAEATRLVEEEGSALVWTAWHELELSAAVEARVGRGETTRGEADAVFRAVGSHRRSGFLRTVQPESWPTVFLRGAALAREHGAAFRNRGMDVLHVALCLELGLGNLWSMDGRQRRLAEAAGLEVNRTG